ncbi:MAG: sulfatase [Phycisphaerae bacterium]
MRARLAGWLVLCAAAPFVLWGCSKKNDRAGDKLAVRADESWPNIVLISVDTLRPDHLGCYGYDRNTSPRIDRLATEGVLFENAISSTSWTLPAHAALFTGLADTVHGCLDMDRRLDDSRRTLAERLNEVGYATVGFFSGPALHPVFGMAQGFDKYVDCTSYSDLTIKVVTAGQSLDGGVVESRSNADITNPNVYQEVQAWLKQSQRRPFFMFIHLWDVHFDFIPPPPYDRRFDPEYTGSVTGENFLIDPSVNVQMPKRDLEHIVALYDGEIAWTDEHIGKILDDLDALKLRDSTIVMLLSDHGEEFFEHGRKGHRQTLYDEVIRIPMIVRFPGRIATDQRVREQARMIDVVPTLLELVGLSPPPGVMGQSLVPLFSGGALRQDTLAISELFSVGRALRSFRRLDRKMIHNEQTKSSMGYDLRADPGEKNPLPDGSSQMAKLLFGDAQRARRWLDDFRSTLPVSTAAPELPEKLRQQLESLGYVGGDHTNEEKDSP